MNDDGTKYDEKVEDLDVAPDEAADVKGGGMAIDKLEIKLQPSGGDPVARYNIENAWPSK